MKKRPGLAHFIKKTIPKNFKDIKKLPQFVRFGHGLK